MGKFSSFGTQLTIGDAATPTEAFTVVAGVQDISGPGFTTDIIEVTAHDSPNAFEEFVAGIKRSGEVTFDLALDPADATHDETTGLFAFWQDRLAHNMQLIWPFLSPSRQMDFAGIVIGFEYTAPVSGFLGASITIKPTGEPVFT